VVVFSVFFFAGVQSFFPFFVPGRKLAYFSIFFPGLIALFFSPFDPGQVQFCKFSYCFPSPVFCFLSGVLLCFFFPVTKPSIGVPKK